MPFVDVYVLGSHKLTYERGFAYSSGAHQRHGIRGDIVAIVILLMVLLVVLLLRLELVLLLVVLVVVLLLLVVLVVLVLVLVLLVVVRNRRRALFGVVFPGQTVTPRTAFPERIASVDDTCGAHGGNRRRFSFSLKRLPKRTFRFLRAPLTTTHYTSSVLCIILT